MMTPAWLNINPAAMPARDPPAMKYLARFGTMSGAFLTMSMLTTISTAMAQKRSSLELTGAYPDARIAQTPAYAATALPEEERNASTIAALISNAPDMR